VTIALNTGLAHQTDTQARLDRLGIDFQGGRVMLRVTFAQTGAQQDYFVGNQPGDVDTVPGLVAAVQQFAGLRNALEIYLSNKVGVLAGNVS